MSTQQNQSSSNYSSQGSGHGGTQQQYKPDDFSQQAINRGQRRINYELAAGGLKLAKAIEELKKAIQSSSGGNNIDFTEVDKVIAAVYEIANGVADIKPPGCDPS
jgi:hypothetical protein